MFIKLFTFAFLFSCIPNNYILTFALNCNGHVDTSNSNFPEEQPKFNQIDSNEDGSHKDIIANHQVESVPIPTDEFDNDNSDKYNRFVLMPRKFYYPQRVGRGYQWPNDFRPSSDSQKRSEKGMLLDAPEFILNPSAGGGGNSRRVGGLMKSSG